MTAVMTEPRPWIALGFLILMAVGLLYLDGRQPAQCACERTTGHCACKMR
jgi:hypothetical protein